MEKKFKLGVIGAGFMASAIIDGIISANVLDKSQIINSDINETALEKSKSKGINTTTDNVYLVNNSEFVLFAIKPQALSSVLEQIKEAKCDKFISIMAGIKKSKIKSVFSNSLVARCMPNLPCSVSLGATGLDVEDYSDIDDVEFIKSLFSSISSVVTLEEGKLNAVTGVSGSSPAYFYLFIKGIVEAGVKNGLDYQDALILATNTMRGSAEMILKNKDKSLDDLINAVCSKGGTTIEAIKVYNENNITKITEKAVEACIKRSTELENL